MADTVDSTLEPLLSPSNSSPVFSSPFSFTATQSQTTAPDLPSLPPVSAYQDYQDIPTEKPETTRVLVRNLSRRSSLKNRGALPTFTITKVTKIDAAHSPVIGRNSSQRRKMAVDTQGPGGSHRPSPVTSLSVFVECANETEQKPTPPPSPPPLPSTPPQPSPPPPSESASPPLPSGTPDSPSDPASILRNPPLRRHGYAYSSKYAHLHSGLKRIRQGVEEHINEKFRRRSSDIGSPEVFTADGGAADTLRGSKSSLRVTSSQSDVFNLCHKDSGVFSTSQLRDVAARGRLFAKRKKFRLVHQTGECNIQYVNVDKRGARFLLDIFTTLVALPWRYNIIVYLVSFLLTWMLFALVWWALHTIYGVDENGENPCVQGVHSFTTAFLFSIETQHTIGYGSRYITDRCPPAVCMLILQSVFGAVMQCVVTGIVFAKLARPNRRAETIMFSKKAVIRRDRDDRLCLIFRVGDMRSSQLIGVDIHTVLVHKRLNSEKGTIHLEQECLRTTTEANRHHDDDAAGFYFLAWPIKIIHRIDERSPLWNLSPNDLLVSNFEIVVVLEATCEATGATIQVRTSYLPSEILWGHRLVSLLTCQKDNGRFKVDYSQFDEVAPVYTPEVSACELSTNKHLYTQRPSDSFEVLDETATTTTFNTAQRHNNNNNNSVDYKLKLISDSSV